MKGAAALVCAALPAGAAAADGGLPDCVRAAEAPRACLGSVVDACLDALPPAAPDAPIFQWRENDRLCWARETAAWDAILNQTYRKVMARLDRVEPDATASLRRAQRAWIAFRDAECAWPAAYLRQNNLHHHDKSCVAVMTAERISRLSEHAEFLE